VLGAIESAANVTSIVAEVASAANVVTPTNAKLRTIIYNKEMIVFITIGYLQLF